MERREILGNFTCPGLICLLVVIDIPRSNSGGDPEFVESVHFHLKLLDEFYLNCGCGLRRDVADLKIHNVVTVLVYLPVGDLPSLC